MESAGLAAGQQSPFHPPEPCPGSDPGPRGRLHAPVRRLPRGARRRSHAGTACRRAELPRLPRHPGRAPRRSRFDLRRLPPAAGAGGPAHPSAGGGVPGSRIASRPGVRLAGPWEAGAGEGSAGRRLVRHVPCPRLLHRVPRQRPGGAGHPGTVARTRALWRTRRSSRRRRTTPTRTSCAAMEVRPGRERRSAPSAIPRRAASPATPARLPACRRSPRPAPGRGRGAVIHRERPASHGLDFSELHAEPASARPQSCSACHARPECLSCHRPDAAPTHAGLPPRRLPHQSPGGGLQQGELLQRLPQPGAVLRQLPPECRPGLTRPAARPPATTTPSNSSCSIMVRRRARIWRAASPAIPSATA